MLTVLQKNLSTRRKIYFVNRRYLLLYGPLFEVRFMNTFEGVLNQFVNSLTLFFQLQRHENALLASGVDGGDLIFFMDVTRMAMDVKFQFAV